MFDFHAHLGNKLSNDLFIASTNINEYDDVKSYKYHSYGLLNTSNYNDLNIFKNSVINDNNCFIGEVGLDKRLSYTINDKILSTSLALAADMNKVIIFHIVRMYDVFFKELKKYRLNVPFIVHGFTASEEIAKEIYKHGGYISLNTRCENTKDFKDLLNYPFLLETDLKDDENRLINLSIWYEKIANYTNMDKNELERIMNERRTIFKNI